MNKQLTDLQAFNAMRLFLEGYYKRTHSDDVGSILGDLQLFPEGGTFDPAAWEDWMDAINEVLKKEEKKQNTP